MKVSLAYGRGALEADFPDGRTDVIIPQAQQGLSDERAAVLEALENPVEAEPLRRLIGHETRICVIHTDITRATPNERLIPWLLQALEAAGADREKIVLLNGLGTHRANTRVELEGMLTPEVVARYRCVNHEPHNMAAHVQAGSMRDGSPAFLNRLAVEADLRIVTGFIEPHFFAGFSGGPKGIMPGVAALGTVQSNHGATNIGDRRACFGRTEGNPIWEEMRDVALRAGPSFLLNVALNEDRAITGVFAGDLIGAHRQGCEFVRASAMQEVEGEYDAVVTTNSGYPLDMNLYQGVKGMRAAAAIVRKGGAILLVAECAEGTPAESPYARLLESVSTPAEMLNKIQTSGFLWPEQWQAHIQAMIQERAEVHLLSSLPEAAVRAAHLRPCASVSDFLTLKGGGRSRVAVLPQGPLTVPYLRTGS